MRRPFDGVYAYLRISSFGDNLEFAFFGALTPVGAFFILEVNMFCSKCGAALSAEDFEREEASENYDDADTITIQAVKPETSTDL